MIPNYIAKILGCSRIPVRKGAAEVNGFPLHAVKEIIGKAPSDFPKIRKAG